MFATLKGWETEHNKQVFTACLVTTSTGVHAWNISVEVLTKSDAGRRDRDKTKWYNNLYPINTKT